MVPIDSDALAALRAVETELDRRWPESRIEPSLTRIAALVDLLGMPQRSYPVLHIAGTNGKTSVARMLDALLGEIGLRMGRYTSPHLQRVTERIGLHGEPI
ncbi:MAG: dihydrofolate synthase, partial [Pseudonocardiaceae bacterium]